MAALRGELSNPLFRNAYALMVNGGLTGVLGLGYWLLAARFYDPAQVGRQSAQNQAMMFLGGLTALNFILIRFVPEMGRRTRALALRTYLAGALAAGTLAVGLPVHAPAGGAPRSRTCPGRAPARSSWWPSSRGACSRPRTAC